MAPCDIARLREFTGPGFATSSATPLQLLSIPSHTSADGAPGVHESAPKKQYPVAAQGPTPHDVGKKSAKPSQSLSRLSHTSTPPGCTAALESSQSSCGP